MLFSYMLPVVSFFKQGFYHKFGPTVQGFENWKQVKNAAIPWPGVIQMTDALTKCTWWSVVSTEGKNNFDQIVFNKILLIFWGYLLNLLGRITLERCFLNVPTMWIYSEM